LALQASDTGEPRPSKPIGGSSAWRLSLPPQNLKGEKREEALEDEEEGARPESIRRWLKSDEEKKGKHRRRCS